MSSQFDKICEILTSDEWSEGEKFIVMWQFNATMKLLGHFKTALIEAICLADDENMERLNRGFPSEVQAYLDWNRHGLGKRLRDAGLDV